jgi:hypothetical protein
VFIPSIELLVAVVRAVAAANTCRKSKRIYERFSNFHTTITSAFATTREAERKRKVDTFKTGPLVVVRETALVGSARRGAPRVPLFSYVEAHTTDRHHQSLYHKRPESATATKNTVPT